MKILLVDDEPDILEFQKSFLLRRKHEVITAFNTNDAIDAIRNKLPDIVFCDVRIDSDRAGLEILKQAKEINSKIEFYLVTGFLEKELQALGLGLGAKEVLTKPISNEVIEKRVLEFIKK
ncbi:MAG: response regulator [Candidatus Omnitrophota bacterium]|jgi:DNA-binding response OmpR family regulator